MKAKRNRDFSKVSAHRSDDDGAAIDVIELPPVRRVRSQEYAPFLSYWNEGREWAEGCPELIASAASNAVFRRSLVARMRNDFWFIRNHRTVAVQTVLDRVRDYSANENLLRLAGVHSLVLLMLVDFFKGGCSCKGDCRSLDFDPLLVSPGGRLCDYMFRQLREHLDRRLS
jgi:hypothetical protein